MEMLKSVFNDNPTLPYWVAGGAAITTSLVLAHKLVSSKRRRRLEKLMQGPTDTVILFQMKRGPYAPSLSPFPMKLETYLRMAKIPYENNYDLVRSTKGKTPWIAYNGEAVADSQMCIEYLNAKRGVDINKHLNPEQRAVAKSLQILTDEHLYWCLAYFRWIHDKEKKVVREGLKVSGPILHYVHHYLMKQLKGQGIGRHSLEEIRTIMMSDLKALSDFLGSKSFIMGEVPCETDCSIFGMLGQWVWHQKDEVLGNLLQEQFPNLHQHCLRMKEKFWPDWENCLLKKNK